tara:strand:+ start:121363 stop:121596 length:234 start_codon:yes stop_codon:yes gene_type:complete
MNKVKIHNPAIPGLGGFKTTELNPDQFKGNTLTQGGIDAVLELFDTTTLGPIMSVSVSGDIVGILSNVSGSYKYLRR